MSNIKQTVNRYTSNMNREDCISYLESNGFAVYDDEPIEDLREAIFQDIKDNNYNCDLI